MIIVGAAAEAEATAEVEAEARGVAEVEAVVGATGSFAVLMGTVGVNVEAETAVLTVETLS
jgi:hypothetical protein